MGNSENSQTTLLDRRKSTSLSRRMTLEKSDLEHRKPVSRKQSLLNPPEEPAEVEDILVTVTVISTTHSDGFIRFWESESGTLLHQMTPDGVPQHTELTCLVADENGEQLLSGDSRGYLYLFQISDFLDSVHHNKSESSRKPGLTFPRQLVSWRAHLTKINTVAVISSPLLLWVSGGVDGSARVWTGVRGQFVGFFGQARPFKLKVSEETEVEEENEVKSEAPISLPYDIRERPVIPQRSNSAKEKERANRNVEYPLRLTMDRWDPFSRTQFIRRRREPSLIKGPLAKPLDKKFFKAIIKPRHQQETIFANEFERNGAVFGNLPFYRVKTPPSIAPPTGLIFADLNKNETRKRKLPNRQSKVQLVSETERNSLTASSNK